MKRFMEVVLVSLKLPVFGAVLLMAWGLAACTQNNTDACPSDGVQVDGVCRTACNSSRDCPQAEMCDPSLGACVPRQVGASSSSGGVTSGQAGSGGMSAPSSSGGVGSSAPGTSRASSSTGMSTVSGAIPGTESGSSTSTITGPACAVDGTVVAAGTVHPQNPCLQCDPARDPGAWSVVPEGVTCGGGRVCVGVACTQGCYINGQFHAPDGPEPNNPCATCKPAVTTTAFTPLADGSDCGNGQSCTSGACGMGCTVDSMTVPSGQLNPANPCESCQPGVAATAWTPRSDLLRCDDDGTVCNGILRCMSGACSPAEPARTCDAPQACQLAEGATCDATTGACTYALAPDGTSCGAGQVCVGATCRAGCLVNGTFHAAGAVDPASPCRTCQPQLTTSDFSPVTNGTDCDDGNRCNGVSACVAGACEPQSAAVTCTAGPCQGGGTCDPATGTCSFTTAQNGESCGNGQVCNNGQCGMGCNIGGTAYSPGAADPQNACRTCQPGVSTSQFTPLQNGTSCEDDGNVCNGTRSCQAGTCMAAGSAVTCTPGACQQGGTCNAMTGACSFTTAPDGTSCGAGQVCSGGACGAGCVIDGVFRASGTVNPVNPCQVCTPSSSTSAWSPRTNGTGCDDGDVCNGVSSCQAGTCTQTTPPVTCTPGACQVGGTCNASNGTCSFGAAANGTSCGSGQVCYGGTCGTGCVIDGNFRTSGTANPTNACQVCDPARSTTAWSARTNGTSCDDGNVCNGVNTCQAGTCMQTQNPVTCTPGACQVNGMCNMTTGACSFDTAANGAACGTGRVCSSGTCSDGCFIGGTFRAAGAVNPSNPCQVCTPGTSTTAWTNRANNTNCDDGNVCNGVSTCQAGTCMQTTAPVTCSPGACQAGGTCNAMTGACTFSTRADGSTCDPQDVCVSGTCTSGCWVGGALRAPGAAHPSDPCLFCDPAQNALGWSARPNNTGCDDGNACNGVSTCQGGSCMQTTAPVTCTPGTCQFGGTCNTTNGSCSFSTSPDGASCDPADVCVGGACMAGCFIDGAHRAVDEKNPTNPCQRCNPGVSTSSWSAFTGLEAACDYGQVCNAGACVVGCFVEGAYYGNGQAAPGEQCRGCNADFTVADWSPLDGYQCTRQGGGLGECCAGLCRDPQQFCAIE